MTVRGWPAFRLVSALCLVAAAAACTSSPGTASPARSATAIPATTPLSPATSPPSPTDRPDLEDVCSYRLDKGNLPVWARSGFSPPYNSYPFVTSKRGDTVGVLFGYPMTAPHDGQQDGRNKVLWVSKTGLSMTVDAQLVGTSQVVRLGDVSVGPSYVDVPQPGCWHMTLHLSGDGSQWTDTLDIVYGKS